MTSDAPGVPTDPPVQTPSTTDRAALGDEVSPERDPLALPGLVAVSAGLALAAPVGGLGAPVLVALWAVAGPVYAATAGALFAAALAPGAVPTALVAAGVAGLVLVPAVRARPRWAGVAGTTLAGVLGAALVFVGLSGGPAVAALVLVVAVALAGYGLSRYSLVRTAYRGSP